MTLSTANMKLIRSLKDKKFRDELGLFVVEGEKLVEEAVQSGFKIEQLYRSEEIGEAAMERISLLNSPSTALAVVRKRQETDGFRLKQGALYIALDAIRDPGNLGTILRIADWFGIDGVIASRDTVDIYNPKVVQSTMGAIFRVDFHYCNLAEVLPGAEVFGTFLSGEDIYKADLQSSGPRVIVIGNESNGISPAIGKYCTRKITIPSFANGKGSESLNAAVATAIAVSEFRRR